MMTNLYPFLLGCAALKHERNPSFPHVEESENHTLAAHCGYLGVLPQSFSTEWTLYGGSWVDLRGFEPLTSSVRLSLRAHPLCPQLIYGCIKSIQSSFMGVKTSMKSIVSMQCYRRCTRLHPTWSKEGRLNTHNIKYKYTLSGSNKVLRNGLIHVTNWLRVGVRYIHRLFYLVNHLFCTKKGCF